MTQKSTKSNPAQKSPLNTNAHRCAITALSLALGLGFSGSVQASLTSYGSYASWSSAVGPQTATSIPDPSPNAYTYFGAAGSSVTYSGVTFSTSTSLSDGAFFNVGQGFSGSPAVLSSQEQSFGVANILITLPSAVTGFSLNQGYGTFNGSPVMFTLGNGDTLTQASTGSGYATPNFVGITDTIPFSTILVTSPDYVLNINNLVTANVAPVPEPSTIIAGALLLLPFGASTLRTMRKRR